MSHNKDTLDILVVCTTKTTNTVGVHKLTLINALLCILIIQTMGFYYLNGTWKLNNSTLTTSDKNKKNSIESFDERYNTLFDNLSPIRYKYNDGTSDRYHTGFIAQDVERAIANSNLDTLDFAGYVKDEEGVCYLRYEEFISLNTQQIQKAKKRIAELENKVAELEALIKGE